MKYKFGLSLSGGGYRAAAFHLGTLRYLDKVGLLPLVECLSTVSGGSIIGAAYCLHVKTGESFENFETDFKSKLKQDIIRRAVLSFRFMLPVLLVIISLVIIFCISIFSHYAWASLVLFIMLICLIVKLQFKLFPTSEIIEQIYDDMFFKKSKLPDLPDAPILVINSTNLQSARLFYFTKNEISDSTYDNTWGGTKRRVFKHEQFPIAKAVMCSSSVPSLFTPIVLDSNLLLDPNDFDTIKPVLVDGGVYDNQGIHKLTHVTGQFECKSVVVSDAGNQLPFSVSYETNILTLLMRTVDVFMTRIKNFQKMINLYHVRERVTKQIAYTSLGWELNDLVIGAAKHLKSENASEILLQAHGLTKAAATELKDDELKQYLEDKINYSQISKRFPSAEQITIAKNVRTNLTALTDEQINALSLFAECMTEIQVMLYCPVLTKSINSNKA